MRKQRLQTVAVTSLIWTICLSSCGSLAVRTWFLDSEVEKALIRKGDDGSVKEKLSYLEAYGYRCYSAADDEAWRLRLFECCQNK